MDTLNPNTLNIGDRLPTTEFGPISRHLLALYCGGSGDHNPIHVDSDFAKAAGYDDVFVYGMLSMAILGRMLTSWTERENIRTFSVRFVAMTQLHDSVTTSAQIVGKITRNGEQLVVLDIETHTQAGTKTLSGSATIKVS